MKDIKQYYKELGKLVYAVAIADGNIQQEEIDTLHSHVARELAQHEPRQDSSGMNYAFYTDFEFENVAGERANVESCIDSYIRFSQDNFERGDEQLIQRSMQLLEHIAKAYLKQNEKQIITLVRSQLNRLPGQHNTA